MRLLNTSMFALAFCLSAFFAGAQASLAAEAVLLKGKVLDWQGHPVAGARVVLRNEDSNKEASGKSNGEGYFEIEHEICSTISFDVFPQGKTGLASAHYAHVSGELSKHMIIQLQKGFHVSGRVLAEGAGIKGLELKVIADDNATVHGGGAGVTNGKGEFNLLLTPGKKIIQIKNDLYSNLSPIYQHEVVISGDTRLPDMTLPLLKN